MKIRFLSLISLLLISITGFSQPLHIDWQNCFGGPGRDNAADVAFTGDGYLIGGYRGGSCWLFKIDLEGNLMWEKELESTMRTEISQILPTEDGNYILVASTYTVQTSLLYYILKIDGLGNIIWESAFGGSTRDNIWNATLTSDGGVVIIGYTGSNDGDISTYYGGWDNWMLKVSSTGKKVWDFTIGTSDIDYGTYIIETSDHGLLVATSSTVGPGGNIECEPFNINAEIILFKLDSMANVEWQQCYGGSGHDWVHTMIETKDGYLLAASVSSEDGDLEGSGYHYGYYNNNFTSDIWLAKIDYSGNIRWHKCYGGSKNEWPVEIFHDKDDGFVVFGVSSSQDGDVFGNHSQGMGMYNIWAFAITEEGELRWQQCLGGSNEEIASAIQLNKSEYVIVSDLWYGPRGDVTCSHNTGDRDAWIFKVTNTLHGLGSDSPAESLFKVYPNPAQEYVVFELTGNEGLQSMHPGLSGAEISITDIFGRVVAEIPVTGGRTIWEIRNNLPGVYFYRIANSKIINNGKVIVGKSN